jgi:alkylation response protein AidB-like acyl-CoA dehydrogenase
VTAPVPHPAGPSWVQILLSIIGILGGTGGVGAMATVLLQRRKFHAEAADVLTDTALILVQPLKLRVAELEAETIVARQQVEKAAQEVSELRAAVREATAMIRRWRSAILAPNATIGQIRTLVSDTRSWHDDVHQG